MVLKQFAILTKHMTMTLGYEFPLHTYHPILLLDISDDYSIFIALCK